MKYLCIRIDDISLFNNSIQKQICDEILKYVIPTLGVVLFKNTQYNHIMYNFDPKVLQEYRGFCLGLHGITHENVCSDFEFAHWSIKRENLFLPWLLEGHEILGTNVFIPPHNCLDSRWVQALKKSGFLIVSSTKRELVDSNCEFLECPTGVISRDIIYIPQTCFIKRKYYYANSAYFDKLLGKILEYYKRVDLTVLTIHWWDFIDKDILDSKFFEAFLIFLKQLSSIARGITLHDAADLSTENKIDPNFFYEGMI